MSLAPTLLANDVVTIGMGIVIVINNVGVITVASVGGALLTHIAELIIYVHIVAQLVIHVHIVTQFIIYVHIVAQFIIASRISALS